MTSNTVIWAKKTSIGANIIFHLASPFSLRTAFRGKKGSSGLNNIKQLIDLLRLVDSCFAP